jgi:hypothetical protein
MERRLNALKAFYGGKITSISYDLLTRGPRPPRSPTLGR